MLKSPFTLSERYVATITWPAAISVTSFVNVVLYICSLPALFVSDVLWAITDPLVNADVLPELNVYWNRCILVAVSAVAWSLPTKQSISSIVILSFTNHKQGTRSDALWLLLSAVVNVVSGSVPVPNSGGYDTSPIPIPLKGIAWWVLTA